MEEWKGICTAWWQESTGYGPSNDPLSPQHIKDGLHMQEAHTHSCGNVLWHSTCLSMLKIIVQEGKMADKDTGTHLDYLLQMSWKKILQVWCTWPTSQIQMGTCLKYCDLCCHGHRVCDSLESEEVNRNEQWQPVPFPEATAGQCLPPRYHFPASQLHSSCEYHRCWSRLDATPRSDVPNHSNQTLFTCTHCQRKDHILRKAKRDPLPLPVTANKHPPASFVLK